MGVPVEIAMGSQPGDYYGGSAWRLLWGVSLEITMGISLEITMGGQPGDYYGIVRIVRIVRIVGTGIGRIV